MRRDDLLQLRPKACNAFASKKLQLIQVEKQRGSDRFEYSVIYQQVSGNTAVLTSVRRTYLFGQACKKQQKISIQARENHAKANRESQSIALSSACQTK